MEEGRQTCLFTTVSHTALGSNLVPRGKPNQHRGPYNIWLTKPTIWRTRLMLSSALRRLVSMEKKKTISLATLVIQTTCLVLTIRYSRIAHVSGPRYLTSTAVILSEVIKLFTCIVMVALTEDKSLPTSSVREQVRETLRLAVPSGLYTLQNNLQFVAMSSLDAATFQVTYQLKILTTAMFSVMFLKRQLTNLKWVSLVLLTVGVALVQLPVPRSCHGDECVDTDESVGRASWMMGLSAVIAMCLSSGFAGVYFEKVLKSSQQSLWIRNVQLAVSGIIFGVMCAAFSDTDAILQHGFFQGYNVLTWLIVIQQAALGLVVSLVIKYADNIVKGFASALSIVLSCLVSYLIIGDLTINCVFLLGAAIVISATFLYSVNPSQLHNSHSKSDMV
ncbi:UDP-N-acetylglucosamine transporter-like isoform X1 [Haliotis rufescens]|uniref:UDP-N-acetylglucosamine transporter-like isoform X1 n=2 Tax=Haliotis rufescens TaxID=6454 RepID=UPI001EAFE696|nr:UDP-N-acetylglucosamine transporter-like isoform X1 [Haliotis rufescens]